MMGTGDSLVERVRARLQGQPAMREHAMFGGRAFMVNERLVVSVGGGDDLLVRADPGRVTELLAVDGARPAEMGGRSMGPSWLLINGDAVGTDEGLSFWLDVALAYNTALGGKRRDRQAPAT